MTSVGYLDALQILGEVRFGERLDAVVVGLGTAHHALLEFDGPKIGAVLLAMTTDLKGFTCRNYTGRLYGMAVACLGRFSA
jgi:hypothetical protein